jgi:SAM-dependent methyltransferase
MADMPDSGSEEFARRMMRMWNDAGLALMVSIGHRTGLFDVMATLPPSTSSEVAASAELDERYVREWLAAMTTGKIVDYERDRHTYSLPSDRAAWLTRSAGLNNLATGAQYVGLLGMVEDQIVECFRNGGGVPYSAYPRFQAVMAEDSNAVHDATLIDVTLPLVPELPDRLREGIDVADVGCGSGHAINLMAEAFPRSRFTGFDFSDTGLTAARSEAAGKSLTNAGFVNRDAASLDETAAFDFITSFDAVHDQARPDRMLAGIARALRSDGVYLCVDFRASSALAENVDHPLGTFFYTISCMHCMTVSLADDGMGLGTMWGEQKAMEMLRAAGFSSIEVAHVDDDIVSTYYICRLESATRA